MARAINNPSRADVLMESMRAMGYSFESALADIIDNSIGVNAKNVQIYFPSNPENCFVAICDDGEGMDSDALLQAMRYGSSDPNLQRNEKDLGRFGLGLKTASLSQCRKLTVISKFDEKISAFCWDLDFVKKAEDWELLQLDSNEIKLLPCISYLDDKISGTIVLWENFDVFYKTRTAGQRYDAHHIKPLAFGGENVASNLTPLSADVHMDHRGVHSLDGAYGKMEKIMGGS